MFGHSARIFRLMTVSLAIAQEEGFVLAEDHNFGSDKKFSAVLLLIVLLFSSRRVFQTLTFITNVD